MIRNTVKILMFAGILGSMIGVNCYADEIYIEDSEGNAAVVDEDGNVAVEGADGSVYVEDADGNSVHVDADGNMLVEDEDGNSALIISE